jgi:ABC-type phosphate/phosphonate transport system substrate-binding protein
MIEPLVIGAVAYTPNVVSIWDGMRDYFAGSDAPIDFVLFSNYARQVDTLLAGHIDIAWNTNLAYVRTVRHTGGTCRALAMRDTDTTFSTVFVGRAGSGMSGPASLKGRRLALGSADSAHAAILPLHYLRVAGVDDADLQLIRFDTDIGKHGDTGASELDAIGAVLAGEADAAAIGISTWESIGRDQLMPGALEQVWQTEQYCHCMFTALGTLPRERWQPWVTTLFAMDWARPEHRRILELEGLRRWVPPRLDGYRTLFEAVAEQGIDASW